MLTKLNGYKTYLVMAALLAVVVLEKGFGLVVPGVALGEDWMLVVLKAIGLGTLRHGIGKGGCRRFRECLRLCVSDRFHAVFKCGQASKRPVNIMAS